MTIYDLYTKGLVDGADLIKVIPANAVEEEMDWKWKGQLSDCPLMFVNKTIENISSLYAEKPDGSIISALLISILTYSIEKGE